jgi:hypothetical protein
MTGGIVPESPSLIITVKRAKGFYLATFQAKTTEGNDTFLGRGPSIERAVDVGLEKVRDSIRLRKGRTSRSVKIQRELMSEILEKRK